MLVVAFMVGWLAQLPVLVLTWNVGPHSLMAGLGYLFYLPALLLLDWRFPGGWLGSEMLDVFIIQAFLITVVRLPPAGRYAGFGQSQKALGRAKVVSVKPLPSAP